MREMVVRERLLRDLQTHADTPVVLVVGGAGYGKTVLLDQWCGRSQRPLARVPLRPRHDDGTALLVAVLDALHEVEPVPAATRRRIVSAELDWSSVVLPSFARLLARRTVPCTVVLDDVHFLKADGPRTVLDLLAHGLPDGWQLVLASRTAPAVDAAKLSVDGRLWSISPEQLLMTPDESVAVLRAMDLALDQQSLEALVARAEGWAVALYLLAVGLDGTATPGALAVEFPGDDLALASYLRDEVLVRLDDDVRSFLLRTSILEDLHPALCDAVVGRDDSSARLRELATEHTFVRATDGEGNRYRVHQLLRELLAIELQREEAGTVPHLHRRASEWYAANGDHVAAVEQALATDDDVYMDALVWRVSVGFLGGGLDDTVKHWLDAFPFEVTTRRPTLATLNAWYAMVTGDTASVRAWTEIVDSMDRDDRLPDGSTVAGAAALLRALVGLDGVTAMLRDAETARAGHLPTSPVWSMVLLLQGTALRLLGRADEAARVFAEGAALGPTANAAGYCHCRCGLAHLAAERDEWVEVEAIVDECLGVLEGVGLDHRAAMAGPFALASWMDARRGAPELARRRAERAVFLVGMLVQLGPWMVVETCLDLARTELQLGNPGAARALFEQARAHEHLVADSPVLVARIEALAGVLDATSVPLGLHASAMTPAELRVLRFLPTHLTFGAIADELFVSRNTVKTQAIAIYRKLGVSSRDAAVAEARRLQLLG